MFFRKHFQCRFGVHWNMKYDSGKVNDIGHAGTCLDCGYRAEKIEWPTRPARSAENWLAHNANFKRRTD